MVKVKNFNDALKKLNSVRVYQSFCKENEFYMEVSTNKGGSYTTLKQLIKIAEKEGYKYDSYYERYDSINGDYVFNATMYVEDGKVECDYSQDGVHKY